jgi:transglutaminase-like putative cysteine protease
MGAPKLPGQSSASTEADRFAKVMSAKADLAVTGALCILVLVAAIGFARVFSGASWAPPVVVSVVAASAAIFVARRLGLRDLTAAIGGLVAVWVASCTIVLWKSTQYGLPLLGTMRAAAGVSRHAAASFMAATAPVHPMPGFVLWSAWGAGAALIAADWLVFRRQSIGAVVPPLLVFVTASVLGVPAGRTWAVATFVAATLVFVLVYRWASGAARASIKVRTLSVPSSERAQVLGHPITRRPRPFLASGTAFIAIAVVAGTVVVPALGRDGAGTAGWRRLFNTTARVTPDPFVSIHNELLQGSRTRLFVVQSTTAAYWRLTGLQYFDGTTWAGSGTYRKVHNRLVGTNVRPGHRQVVEIFDIQQLGSPWLPVAFQPEAVSAGATATYDPTSGSLLSPKLTADGESYRVVADEDLSSRNATLLGRVRAITSKDRSARAQFLQLPTDIPPSVWQLSRRLSPPADSEYQKALALQRYFRRPPFRYTLDPPAGSGSKDLVGFLLHTHAGYCQQYASAYALLARMAGLPARVAVGFTTGTPIGPDKWQVYGADAHAWPEVWFPTVGWVSFEPTPTFPIPSTAFAGRSGKGLTEPGTLVSRPHMGQTGNPVAGSLVVSAGAVKATGRYGRFPLRSRAGDHRRGAEDLFLIVIWAFAGLVFWVSLVRTGEKLRWWRRRLRLLPGNRMKALAMPVWKRRRPLAGRSAARTLSDTDSTFGGLLLTWEELSEDLGLSGLIRRASETPSEFVHRAAEALRRGGTLSCGQENDLVEIGESFSRAVYSEWRPPVGQACRLQASAQQIGRRARTGLGWGRRLVRYLDPRTTWRPVPAGPLLAGGADARLGDFVQVRAPR